MWGGGAGKSQGTWWVFLLQLNGDSYELTIALQVYKEYTCIGNQGLEII